MSKDMIGSITRALVGVPFNRQGVILDIVNRLGDTSTDGDIWCSRFGAVIQEGLSRKKEPKPTVSILELVPTTTVTATAEQFIAKEGFVLDTSCKAKVKISYLGDNFKDWFLKDGGKVEEPIAQQTLRYHKLREASRDGPIIAELGGEAKAETTLTEMFSLMEKQKNGEAGALLNNGYANIFYIKDSTGALRAVHVRWFGDGWLVGADSIGFPNGWDGGSRVFSRNS